MPKDLTTVAKNLDFSPEDIQTMLDNLDQFSPEEVAEIDKMVDELASRQRNDNAKDDLIEFCKRMQPDYKVGKHHRILADMLMDIEVGDKDRICVNIPPRHGKSQLVSIFFPAWFLGRNPGKKVMMVSHTTDLAVDFGRKVRNLISVDDYKEIFPQVSLAVDSKSAGRWNTNLEENIMRVVLGLRLQDVVLIFCLLMTLILSRMLLTGTSLCLRKHTNGSPSVPVLALCRAVGLQ